MIYVCYQGIYTSKHHGRPGARCVFRRTLRGAPETSALERLAAEGGGVRAESDSCMGHSFSPGAGVSWPAAQRLHTGASAAQTRGSRLAAVRFPAGERAACKRHTHTHTKSPCVALIPRLAVIISL